MKYPIEQFNVLKEYLKKLSIYLDINSINPSLLHYIVFQQHSEGQRHNWLVSTVNGLKKVYQLDKDEEHLKLFDTDYNFEMYPNDTNDVNIETAVKKALKEINN